MKRITTLTHLTEDSPVKDSLVRKTRIDRGHHGMIDHEIALSESTGSLPADQVATQSSESLEVLLSVYDTLLDRFMPPLILINARRRVIDTFSGADRFLRFGSRRPSEDVLDLLVEPVRESVRKAFALCCSTGQTIVTEPIVIEFGPDNQLLAFSDLSDHGSTSESAIAPRAEKSTCGDSADDINRYRRAFENDGEVADKRNWVAQKFRVRVAPVPHRKDDSPFFSIR